MNRDDCSCHKMQDAVITRQEADHGMPARQGGMKSMRLLLKIHLSKEIS